MHKTRNILEFLFIILILVVVLTPTLAFTYSPLQGNMSYVTSLRDTTAIDSIAIDNIKKDSVASDSMAIDSTTLLLSPKEKKKLIKEQEKHLRDSLRDVKDSLRRLVPRIMTTSFIPDSLKYKRIIAWTAETHFNKLERSKIDTTYNDWFSEYPFFQNDINGVYLGTIGSAMMYQNYFKRIEEPVFKAYSNYLPYTYTPETMPMYNTKTPYTELAYWGTLFASKDREESNVKFLHTQNITPKFNFSILYKRYGSKGLLENESTDNRTFALTANYLGDRYVANGGYIHNKVTREENGGVQKTSEVTDTIVDAKTIAINLSDAKNVLKKNTFYISQSYSLPMNFFRKNKDSLASGDGTIAYLGHYGEFSNYSRKYTDDISGDSEKEYYYNKFYINPSSSYDSTKVVKFENRFFIRLQPWARDAILSKVEGGLGDQILTIDYFQPSDFIYGQNDNHQNNMYVYGGASGLLKKYFDWDAFVKYHFAGYNINDLQIKGKMRFSFYPFENKKESIDFTTKFSQTLTNPTFYENHYYSNHLKWDNNFDKISRTNLEGTIAIPKWDLSAFFGYSLVGNDIYYDQTGMINQYSPSISVISAYINKKFQFGILHLDNQALFQASSNTDIIPLPTMSFNLRYYIEFNIVKDVCRAQLGASTTYESKYYAPSYNPASAMFVNQKYEKVGGSPYVDAFLNLQWYRACIFFKYTNASLGNHGGEYFSAYHYIKPQKAFKFGIYWPFYVH